jgi:hypothetical protein
MLNKNIDNQTYKKGRKDEMGLFLSEGTVISPQ